MSRLPMKLQIFAEPGSTDPEAQATPPAGQPQTNAAPAAPQIDYDKIAQLIQGKQSVAEESVLKGYFKQQGLSKEEAEQAMASFKQQQAAQQPNVNALQTKAAQAHAMAQQKEVENQAILQAIQLGIDAKTVPYVLKLADLSNVMGQDGTIAEEALKGALNKVLEDVPALKPTAEQTSGFKQIGAGGGQQTGSNDLLSAAFGNKK